MKIGVKHKRGIRIQTRFITSAILLLCQLLLLFVTVYTLQLKYFAIWTIAELFAIITVIYMVNCRKDPSYKIAWIIFILIFPIFGVSVYLLWGGGRFFPQLKKKMLACEAHYKSYLPDDGKVFEKLKYSDYLHSRQASYLKNEAGFPVFSDTSVEYLSPGEKFLPRFIEELEKAEKYIYMEFFIIAEGEMWEQVSTVLRKKAAAGVEVRVLFDDFSSIKRQHKDFIKKLRSCGIKVAIFNKIGPKMNFFMNNRNHRKIVVIDGKVAITGGLNLADEYTNAIKRFGYWLDCAVILKGNATSSFLAMFCSTWEFTTGERLDMEAHLSGNYNEGARGFVLPYSDGPLDDKNPAEGIYMQILNTAQRYVHITSPYLIIDNTMATVLKIAAKSGIDVKIITPHIPDKWYVHPVTQYNYLELLETGVKIYEYTPGFIHSKIFVSDDCVATVGTVNMDYRSFILHFECGVWMSGVDAVADIRDDFERILSQSQEITLADWQREPVLRRMKRAILHIFAPFM